MDNDFNKNLKIVATIFSKRRFEFMLRSLVVFKKEIKIDFDVLFLISSLGDVEKDFIERRSSELEFKYTVEFYEDNYMDYSSYKKGLFMSRGYNGVIFINDTVSSKHRSLYQLNKFSQRINVLVEEDVAVPILAGEICRSEYRFFEYEDFVPTYLFYVNKSSFDILENIFNGLEEYINNIDYSPFVKIHSLFLKRSGVPDSLLNRKIACCIAERKISKEIRERGIICYTNTSIIYSIVVYVEIKIRTLFEKFNLLKITVS